MRLAYRRRRAHDHRVAARAVPRCAHLPGQAGSDRARSNLKARPCAPGQTAWHPAPGDAGSDATDVACHVRTLTRATARPPDAGNRKLAIRSGWSRSVQGQAETPRTCAMASRTACGEGLAVSPETAHRSEVNDRRCRRLTIFGKRVSAARRLHPYTDLSPCAVHMPAGIPSGCDRQEASGHRHQA